MVMRIKNNAKTLSTDRNTTNNTVKTTSKSKRQLNENDKNQKLTIKWQFEEM